MESQGERTITLNEFKCVDCDQLFLLPGKSKAKFCPRCGSDGIQYGAVTEVRVMDTRIRED